MHTVPLLPLSKQRRVSIIRKLHLECEEAQLHNTGEGDTTSINQSPSFQEIIDKIL